MAAIAVGEVAIDRTSTSNLSTCRFLKANPSNGTGTITTAQLWLNTNGTAVEVATASASTNNITTVDSVALGAVTAGSEQTFGGLSMAVNLGNYIGIYGTAGKIEQDSTDATSGYWYKVGDYIPCTNEAFTWLATLTAHSVYGTGTTGGLVSVGSILPLGISTAI